MHEDLESNRLLDDPLNSFPTWGAEVVERKQRFFKYVSIGALAVTQVDLNDVVYPPLLSPLSNYNGPNS